MKTLLLGKDGQVGRALRRSLFPCGEIIAVGRAELDLENLTGLNELLLTQKPDIIVNAAAYTAVDKAEREQYKAFLINADRVNRLAEYACRTNALLIHYSTDYVFDGQKKSPYVETDHPNPLNHYAASKRAGETAIINSGCHFLLFRVSWVFAEGGNNFINTILRLAEEKDTLHIVADQHGAPTSADLIADVTALALRSYQQGNMADGIYHVSSSGHTTWYHLACYVLDKRVEKGFSSRLNSQNIYPISTEEYPLPARRPKNSCLSTSLLRHALNIQMPDWHVDVDRFIEKL